MTPKSVYIAWDEIEADARQEYVGGGVYGIRYENQRTVTRKALYSNANTAEMRERAAAYVAESLANHDTKTNLRVLLA
jgi:hypothetical protein